MKAFKMNTVKADLCSYGHYILLGHRKIGKSTFFRDLVIEEYGSPEKGLLISMGTENGYHALDNLQVAEAPVFNQEYDEETDTQGLVQVIDDIVENNKQYGLKIVAFDTFDCLYDIAEAEAIRLSRKETGKPCKSINEAFGGYGRGLDRIIDLIQEQLSRLESIGIAVFIISHVKEKTRTDMLSGTEYQVWTNNLMDKVYGAIADTAQMVMMAVFDREINNGRVIGEERLLYLRATATLDAGSRFNGLPDSVPFTPRAFLDAFELGVKNSVTTKPMSDAEFAAARKSEQVASDKKAEIARKKDAEVRKEKENEDVEAMRAEYVSAISAKFPGASAAVKTKAKELLFEAGASKFTDASLPVDVLKQIVDML